MLKTLWQKKKLLIMRNFYFWYLKCFHKIMLSACGTRLDLWTDILKTIWTVFEKMYSVFKQMHRNTVVLPRRKLIRLCHFWRGKRLHSVDSNNNQTFNDLLTFLILSEKWNHGKNNSVHSYMTVWTKWHGK